MTKEIDDLIAAGEKATQGEILPEISIPKLYLKSRKIPICFFTI